MLADVSDVGQAQADDVLAALGLWRDRGIRRRCETRRRFW